MKKGKRSNGMGSVYRRKDGSWEVSVTKPKYLGGGRITHRFKTRRECDEWLNNYLRSIQEGSFPLSLSITLGDWLQTWISDYCINVRPATRVNYECYTDKHLAAHSISKLPLCQVTTHSLQGFVNHLTSEGRLDGTGGLSPKTVRNIMQMLHAAFKQAKGNKLVADNPVEYVVLPKIESRKVDVLDIEAQEQLIEAANGTRFKNAIILLLGTGVRIGELLALRESDFRCEGEIYYLDINKTLERVKDYDGETNGHKTVLHEGLPKTDNSQRQIALSPDLTRLIKEHIAQLHREADVAYGLYNPDPYLVCNELGNRIDPSNFRKYFNEIVKKSGLTGRITPHTCRHSFSSIAAKYLGIRDVADTLGHSDPAFTNRVYVHSDLKGRYSAMCELEQQIKAVKGGENCDG